MSDGITLHVLKLWLKKLNLLQVLGILLCPVLIWYSYQPWIQVNPPENLGKWLQYFPVELIRKYIGNEIVSWASWFPLLIMIALALPSTRKYSSILFIPYTYFLYSNAKWFEITTKKSIPFYDYISSYIIEYQYLGDLYIFGFVFAVAFFLSIIQLFK